MGKYHVVCHDCREEGILDDRTEAKRRQADHEAETGHRVSCEEIAPSISEA